MGNIFTKDTHNIFSWEKLGNIKQGREELGEEMPVVVYRMLEYTVNDILIKHGGQEYSNEIFREAGHLAGTEFAKNMLDLTVGIDEFIARLQQVMVQFKMGILRIESFDAASGEFTLTIAEDLDCSGLPPTNEVVCTYDEGMLSGILEAYTGKKYYVREVDCWANGDRVCRFNGWVMTSEGKD